MLKRAFSIALICLYVIPLHSHASSATDIDGLISSSQEQAQIRIQRQIQENQQLIREIDELSAQIAELKSDIAINRQDTKRNLYIAAGSMIATMLALRHFGKGTGNEVSDSFRILMGMLAGYAGATTTVVAAGGSGVNYLLVKLDEKKLPILERRLQEVKNQLEQQNENLAK